VRRLELGSTLLRVKRRPKGRACAGGGTPVIEVFRGLLAWVLFFRGEKNQCWSNFSQGVEAILRSLDGPLRFFRRR